MLEIRISRASRQTPFSRVDPIGSRWVSTRKMPEETAVLWVWVEIRDFISSNGVIHSVFWREHTAQATRHILGSGSLPPSTELPHSHIYLPAQYPGGKKPRAAIQAAMHPFGGHPYVLRLLIELRRVPVTFRIHGWSTVLRKLGTISD